jgi:bacillolysin
VPGSYTVTLVAGECGLQNTAAQTITVGTTGILSGTEQKTTPQVYPNPASTFLSVSQEPHRKLTYKIYNLLGEELKSGVLKNPENRIEVGMLPEGIYLLSFFEKEINVSRQKFMKLNN